MTSSEGRVEVIEFLRPDRNDQNLFVTNLPKTLRDTAKYEELSKIFSQFGLIYEVQILESATNAASLGFEASAATGDGSAAADASKSTVARADDSVFCHYAFVKFYSADAAATAARSLNQQWMIDGHVLRVQHATSPQAPAQNSVHLYVSQCRTLANHYLGFNGWCSKIMKLESFSIPDAATLDLLSDLAAEPEDSATFVPGQDQLCYSCVVQLTFPHHRITCHGAGTATVKPSQDTGAAGPIVSAGYAKKAALQRATEDAFSRIVLVVLPSGKVAVEQTRDDPPGCGVVNRDITSTLVDVNCLPDREDDDESDEDGDQALAEEDAQLEEDTQLEEDENT